MKEIFAVRNVDDKTRSVIISYARERNINTGDALRDLVAYAQEYLKQKETTKNYQSVFTIHDKVKFSSGDSEGANG